MSVGPVHHRGHGDAAIQLGQADGAVTRSRRYPNSCSSHAATRSVLVNRAPELAFVSEKENLAFCSSGRSWPLRAVTVEWAVSDPLRSAEPADTGHTNRKKRTAPTKLNLTPGRREWQNPGAGPRFCVTRAIFRNRLSTVCPGDRTGHTLPARCRLRRTPY